MADGILPGLVKGMATTARSLTRHAHTAEYPDVSPALPSRSRGVIALTEENCTSCMLCARECPDWCIYIDSHKEEVAADDARRAGPPAQRPRPLRHRLLALHVLRHLHRGVPLRRPALEPGVRVRRARHPRPAPREGPARGVDGHRAASRRPRPRQRRARRGRGSGQAGSRRRGHGRRSDGSSGSRAPRPRRGSCRRAGRRRRRRDACRPASPRPGARAGDEDAARDAPDVRADPGAPDDAAQHPSRHARTPPGTPPATPPPTSPEQEGRE